jgi:hypothetical protein
MSDYLPILGILLKKISVITVTKNASANINRLIASLEKQTDQDFTWLVQDACSDDGTLDLVNNAAVKCKIIESRPDSGIYDGLNSAIRRCISEYYLVVGSDDELFDDAICQYKASVACTNYDLVAAKIFVGDRIICPKSNLGWLFGMRGVASCHSVGLLIRTGLHEVHGYYSARFPIVADQYFVKSALHAGATITRKGFIAGKYALGGYSGQSSYGYLFEFTSMQFQTEKKKLLQTLLLIIRLARVMLERR